MATRNQASPPTKEGKLLKYRNILYGWESRYFKLERTYLHYYEAKHSPAPKDTVLRNLIMQVKPSAAFPDRQFVFEIQHKSGTIWYCQATSMQEMVEWMSVISNTPMMIDTQQYPISYPQTQDHTPYITPTAPPSRLEHGVQVVTSAEHHHNLYPCLHQDFQNPSPEGQHYFTPPPLYSEVIGHTTVPQK